jgi:polysaccharide deacetylase 2 family uncharacterized protein YibQ
MKQKLKDLIVKVKTHKQLALLGACVLVLTLSLAFMVKNEYLNKNENILKAAEAKQLVVVDLQSGEAVDAKLLTKKPKQEHKDEKKKPNKDKPKAVTLKPGTLSVVISGLGLNISDTERAIALPAPFILSFSPYGEQTLELSKQALEKGHVTLLDLPMQYKNSEIPAGNFGLMVNNNEFRNSQNLKAALSKIFRPYGVTTSPDEVFSKSDAFKTTMHDIAKSKLYVVYTGESETVDNATKELDIEILKPDLVVTPANTLPNALKSAEKMAVAKNYALVVITDIDSANLEKLEKWVTTLEKKNIKLISTGQ